MRMVALARLAVAGATALGIGLTAWVGLGVAGDLVSAISRWGRGPWAPLSLVRRENGERGLQAIPGYTFSMGLVGAGVILALAARDSILSAWILSLCVGLAWWWRGYADRQHRRSEAIPQVLRLLQLLDNYLRDSIIGSLQKAVEEMDESPVRAAADAALKAHFMGAPWGDSIRRHLSGNDLLTRLGLLLAVAPRMENEEVRDAIRNQIREITLQQSLQAEAGAELVLLKLTVRFLAVANAVAAAAALIIPAWRDFFTSTLARRGTFIAASLMVGAAYVYFSEEIELLREEL